MPSQSTLPVENDLATKKTVFSDVNHFRVELDICRQNWKQNKILFALVMSAFCLFRFDIVLMHTIPLLRLNYSAESVQPIVNPTPSSAFISERCVNSTRYLNL